MAEPGPFYIALEGAEGCGKSTHAKRLADAIGAVVTRETGGTAIGQRLRAILHDTTVDDLDDHAETLIVAADRAQHMAGVVRPALKAGRTVVSDRSVYSTIAYQGYGRGLPLDEVRRINEWAMGEIWPDLVVLLTAAGVVDGRAPAQAPARPVRAGRRRLPRPRRRGFAEMAADDPERWVVIDAARSKDDVAGARSGRRVAGAARAVTPLPGIARSGTRVVGQQVAVDGCTRAAAAPVHAYLFVGPAGSTKDEAARGVRRRPADRLRRPARARPPTSCCAASTPTCARSHVSVPRSRSTRPARSCARRRWRRSRASAR